MKCMIASLEHEYKNKQIVSSNNYSCLSEYPCFHLSAGIHMKNSPSANICVNKRPVCMNAHK